MIAISPRLSRLLQTLLAQNEEVSIDTLARILGTSRRTIFRELDGIEKILAQYQAHIVSVARKGIQLKCTPDERDVILAHLNKKRVKPCNRQERLLCLTVELLENAGTVQKSFYYAHVLGVSESSVRSDISELASYLANYGIAVERKTGQGVCAVGSENAIRIALTTCLQEKANRTFAEAYGYPASDIVQGVRDMMCMLSPKLGWMTVESAAFFSNFLMVTVERVQKGALLSDTGGGGQMKLADSVADAVEDRFDIVLSAAERYGLARQIQACRAKLCYPVPPADTENRERIETLTHRMIESFDSRLAPVLKTDEHLVEGLTLHLIATLARIEQKMELPDPLDGQLAARYPGLYEKSLAAVTALEAYAHMPIPASEVSLIAAHFYAAMFSMDEKNIQKRLVRAGIVCVAGIGMSYLLASQIRKRFKGELDIDISGWDDRTAWEKNDFLISTIPLENVSKTVVIVNTLLGDDDFRRIQETIAAHALVGKNTTPIAKCLPLTERIADTVLLLNEVQALLSGFSALPIGAGCTFEELVDFAASSFAANADQAKEIRRVLTRREALSTQVVPEMRLVLLHSRTGAVMHPVFALITPESGAFTGEYFHGAANCALMLLPEDCTPEITRMMGTISGAFVENTVFLAAVQKGNTAAVRGILEAELSNALLQCCGEKLCIAGLPAKLAH